MKNIHILIFGICTLIAFLFPGFSSSQSTTESEGTLGSISGKITYDGQVPKLRPINMSSVPECAAKHRGPVSNPILKLGRGNGLGNVLVYVKNPPRKNVRPPSTPMTIDMRGCLFQPRVGAIMAGQPLKFKNSDGILFNVHGLPKVNREFNIGMPPTLKEKEVQLNKPEPVFKVKCDVHPWMNAYVAVMTHPYFAVTDTDGRFNFRGLPDGEYHIEAWHEKLGTQSKTANISGGSANVNFSFRTPGR